MENLLNFGNFSFCFLGFSIINLLICNIEVFGWYLIKLFCFINLFWQFIMKSLYNSSRDKFFVILFSFFSADVSKLWIELKISTLVLLKIWFFFCKCLKVNCTFFSKNNSILSEEKFMTSYISKGFENRLSFFLHDLLKVFETIKYNELEK